MEQEGVREREIDMPKWQRQSWRQNEMQQPQKCPRCESMNTKFCYYNNNSLTQPRYFCKTCRRHWTLGGTLRNVPFGGGDWYFSSLAKIHSMNHLQSKAFDQSLKAKSDVIGSSSNLGLASTFNGGYAASQTQFLPSQFYQMGSREREELSLDMAKQALINPSNMDNRNNNPTSHNEWTQSFINNANNRSSDAFSWSDINTMYVGGNTERDTNVVGSSPYILNQWPAFQGYGPVL
ncbi:hypothetical protein TanjilG_14625 [Lupinus angustifolius]|uniref:Dof zinc finger protein n=1 Tax=Lupinus angustifolius TaxID=3871 RepID=A0A1J7H560_LUPAN|nr:hypothetical protein TanjilG_14625 [Lupinus angustifolius]